jgi:dihydrodipicolinate synthase/N-acetylneuraminate lyase
MFVLQSVSTMTSEFVPSRRQFLRCVTLAGFYSRLGAATKPLRGAFPIMATPYTEGKAVDYGDLAREVDFMDRCGVQGMVWPQMASEYTRLTRDERMHGMEILAKAAKGKRPALVLGVQAPNTEGALAYLRHADELAPDAVIAMPPTEAKSADDFREYYRALGRATKRPFFIQTTGGASSVVPEVKLLVDLCEEFPNFGYIKEEYTPVIERMTELAAHRPAVKGVFSGNAGVGMLYEMRLGFDGTMPGAPYADLYAQIWDSYQAGEHGKARDLFSKLLLMTNVDERIPGTRQYVMKKRGVFKTTVSRQHDVKLSSAAIQEIEFNFEALKPYLRA